jgi:hypothetical protein
MARGAGLDDEERRFIVAMHHDRARRCGANPDHRQTRLGGDDAAEDVIMELAEDRVEATRDFDEPAGGVDPAESDLGELLRVHHRTGAGGHLIDGLFEAARGATEMRCRFVQPQRDQQQLLRRRDRTRRHKASRCVDHARRRVNAPDGGIDGMPAAAQRMGAGP